MKIKVLLLIVLILLATGCTEQHNDVVSVDNTSDVENTSTPTDIYDDAKFLKWHSTSSEIIENNLNEISNAIDNQNTEMLESQVRDLKLQTQNNLNEIDTFNLSIFFKRAANEYKLALEDASEVCKYTEYGVLTDNELNDFEIAVGYLENASVHIKRTKSMISTLSNTPIPSENVCEYDFEVDRKENIGTYYEAPAGYEYAIVILRLKNNADQSVSTNPYNWKFIADGVEYSYDTASYADTIGHQTVEVNKGGDFITKFVFIIDGDVKDGYIEYDGLSPALVRNRALL